MCGPIIRKEAPDLTGRCLFLLPDGGRGSREVPAPLQAIYVKLHEAVGLMLSCELRLSTCGSATALLGVALASLAPALSPFLPALFHLLLHLLTQGA